jgi:hypothetical protein
MVAVEGMVVKVAMVVLVVTIKVVAQVVLGDIAELVALVVVEM